MVKTDFVLSYLTGSVNDDILEKIVKNKEVEFTISDPDAYWNKQQIKDSYKTPTGSYNKEAFTEDYNNLVEKYEGFQIKKFGESLLEGVGGLMFENGGKIPMYQDGSKLIPAINKKDSWTREEYNNSMYGYRPDTSSGDVNSTSTRKIFTGRVVKTQKGVEFVPDVYTSFSHEAGFIDLAKGKSINELAEMNQGVLDENGNLTTENLWGKIFDAKYVTLDEQGKYQEKISKSGENLALDLKRGVTREGDLVLDKVTMGESVFGAQSKDDYHWQNRDWYEKIPLGAQAFTGGVLRSSWNFVMGLPQGVTSMGMALLATDTEEAPEWLRNTDTFLRSAQSRGDEAGEEAKWYSARGMSDGISSGMGQLGTLAAMTAIAVKANKKMKFSEVQLAQGINMATAVGFGLMGAADVDLEMRAQGNTSANQRKLTQAATFFLLTGVGSVTNIAFSKLEPTVQREIYKNAVKTGLKDVEGILSKVSVDEGVEVASKSIYKHFNKYVSAALSKVNKLTKTQTGLDAGKEFTQESMEEMVPDATMVLFPRLYNTMVDALGGSEKDKFTFNEYGEETYMDVISGKTLENYFSAGVFGGITGGLASSIHNRGKHDQEVTYISALTGGGADWSEAGVEKHYTAMVNQINKEYSNGTAGPTTIGLHKTTLKNTVITPENKDMVTSYADLVKTQAINDLNIARKTVKDLAEKGGFLDQFKTKWDEVNKTVENVEQFNKFALTQIEKKTVNTFLMSEFKSIVSKQTTLKKALLNQNLIAQRNKLLKENNPEEAQKIQEEILGYSKDAKKSKEREKVISAVNLTPTETDTKTLNLVDSYTNQTVEDVQARVESLLNGDTFVRGMQQAFLRTQVSEILDVDTGKPSYKSPLDFFNQLIKVRKQGAKTFSGTRNSTYQQKFNAFNTLNMTTKTYIESLEAKYQEEVDEVENFNKKRNDTQSALFAENAMIDQETINLTDELNDINTTLQDTSLTESEKTILNKEAEKINKTISELENKKDENSSILGTLPGQRPLPSKFTHDANIYFRRVDRKDFVSLDSSLLDYVEKAFKKAYPKNDPTLVQKGDASSDFIDANLKNILEELQIRLAQAELNYGTNRKMADFEKEVIPIMSDLLGGDKTTIKGSYEASKAKVKPIKQGPKNKDGEQSLLERRGSESFLAITNEADYLVIKKDLEELITKARDLKAVSDSNTPDLNISRMQDDLTLIKSQFKVFKEVFNEPNITNILYDIDTLTDNGKAVTDKLTQIKLNELISKLNEYERKLHIGLNKDRPQFDASIKSIEDIIHKNGLFEGYNLTQFRSWLRNIEANDVSEFYGELGAELTKFGKTPSFTQIESIKHAYWSLKNDDPIKVAGTNVFNNSTAVWGSQGSGKTTVVAVMTTKLYSRHLASKTIFNASFSPDVNKKLSDYDLSGKHYMYKGKSHAVYTNFDSTSGEVKNVIVTNENGKSTIENVPKEATLQVNSANVVVAAPMVNRVWALHEEFSKAGVPTRRINANDEKEVKGVSTHADLVEDLIKNIRSGSYNGMDLIVFDEATVLNERQLAELNYALDYINGKTTTTEDDGEKARLKKDLEIERDSTQDQAKITELNVKIETIEKYYLTSNKRSNTQFAPLKVLFLGDLKQAGDVSGFQGLYNEVQHTQDDDFTFDGISKETKWVSDAPRELRVKFRTGNQGINNVIDFLRNEDYKDPKKRLYQDYYQGPTSDKDALKGFKLSQNVNFELVDIEERIKNKVISSSDVVILTTSESKKEALQKQYPYLKDNIKTITEAQGGTYDYEITVPDTKHVYAYTETMPGEGTLNTKIKITQKKEGVEVSQTSVIVSSFFDYNTSGDPYAVSTTNLDYQFANELISATGRAVKYSCLIVEKPLSTSIFAIADNGKKFSKTKAGDVFSFVPLKDSSNKANKDNLRSLIKEEFKHYSGDFTTSAGNTSTGTKANEEVPVEPSTDNTSSTFPDVKISDDKTTLTVSVGTNTEKVFEADINDGLLEGVIDYEIFNTSYKIPRVSDTGDFDPSKVLEMISFVKVDLNRDEVYFVKVKDNTEWVRLPLGTVLTPTPEGYVTTHTPIGPGTKTTTYTWDGATDKFSEICN